MINWTIDEEVVRARVPDAELRGFPCQTYVYSKRLGILSPAELTQSKAWKAARSYPLVAALDAAHDAVVKACPEISIYERDSKWMALKNPFMSAHFAFGDTEADCWLDAAERLKLKTVTDPERGQPLNVTHKVMTPAKAATRLREIFADLQTRFHDQWEWMDAAFCLEVLTQEQPVRHENCTGPCCRPDLWANGIKGLATRLESGKGRHIADIVYNHEKQTVTYEYAAQPTALPEDAGAKNDFEYAAKYSGVDYQRVMAVAAALTHRGWKVPVQVQALPEDREDAQISTQNLLDTLEMVRSGTVTMGGKYCVQILEELIAFRSQGPASTAVEGEQEFNAWWASHQRPAHIPEGPVWEYVMTLERRVRWLETGIECYRQTLAARSSASPVIPQGKPCHCGADPCRGTGRLLDGYVCVRQIGLAALRAQGEKG